VEKIAEPRELQREVASDHRPEVISGDQRVARIHRESDASRIDDAPQASTSRSSIIRRWLSSTAPHRFEEQRIA